MELTLKSCRMIHGVRIKNGKATYVSRFVKTSKLKQEEFYRGSKILKVCIAAYVIMSFFVSNSFIFSYSKLHS